jgi:hypothetical protein
VAHIIERGKIVPAKLTPSVRSSTGGVLIYSAEEDAPRRCAQRQPSGWRLLAASYPQGRPSVEPFRDHLIQGFKFGDDLRVLQQARCERRARRSAAAPFSWLALMGVGSPQPQLRSRRALLSPGCVSPDLRVAYVRPVHRPRGRRRMRPARPWAAAFLRWYPWPSAARARR